MPAKSQTLAAAFERFVELVKPIEDVQYAAAFEPRRPDIYTYIKKRDEDVSKQIYRAEDVIADEFPDLLIEFHVRWLEGRSIEEFVGSAPPLFFARDGLPAPSGRTPLPRGAKEK